MVEQIHSNHSMSNVTLEIEGTEEGMASVHTTREIIEGTEETEESILLMHTTCVIVGRTRKTEETGGCKMLSAGGHLYSLYQLQIITRIQTTRIEIEVTGETGVVQQTGVLRCCTFTATY